jgi:hypothetical protein
VRKDSSNVSQEKGNISKQVKDSPQVRQEKGNISQQGKDFLWHSLKVRHEKDNVPGDRRNL